MKVQQKEVGLQNPKHSQVQTPLPTHLVHLFPFVGLALVAFIPRLLLALQLDVVTDEVVYIFGGKVYLPLLAHFDIGSINGY